MLSIFNIFIILLYTVLVVGSLLPLSSNPHWFIRAWDFPRVQIIVIAIIGCTAFVVVNLISEGESRSTIALVMGLTLATSGWHVFRA
jgi:hypothetical protein